MKERMVGKVPMFLGASEIRAQLEGDSVRLSFRQSDGNITQWLTDHVILATGYKVDLRRLHFLSGAFVHSCEPSRIPRFCLLISSPPSLVFTLSEPRPLIPLDRSCALHVVRSSPHVAW